MLIRCTHAMAMLCTAATLRGRPLGQPHGMLCACRAVHGALRRDAMQAVSVAASLSRDEERPKATMGFLSEVRPAYLDTPTYTGHA
jgi:hypothetical protein